MSIQNFSGVNVEKRHGVFIREVAQIPSGLDDGGLSIDFNAVAQPRRGGIRDIENLHSALPGDQQGISSERNAAQVPRQGKIRQQYGTIRRGHIKEQDQAGSINGRSNAVVSVYGDRAMSRCEIARQSGLGASQQYTGG